MKKKTGKRCRCKRKKRFIAELWCYLHGFYFKIEYYCNQKLLYGYWEAEVKRDVCVCVCVHIEELDAL